jgi:membrane protein insertase Oxa1/YidC/SpoIIIJ
VELRNAPWIGWIKDLSAPDPYFVLPIVYAITALPAGATVADADLRSGAGER